MASGVDSSSPSSGLPPLAIVGMAFRFPDEAITARAFWDMLVSKRCASAEFPPDRMSISAFHHPDTTRLDSLSMRKGHFIKGSLAAFDAPFFSISAAEAEAMDPAQRFTLETAYQAFENAGIPIERVARTKTCVYTGSFTVDYNLVLTKDAAAPAKYHTSGTAMNMTANRVSWFFDLVGPSANVDTACSSSLMALDLVCQSIWNGDSTMGLACGSSVLFAPEIVAGLDNLGFLSKDGRCFSFDHRANGYARGEGFGVVVIKPLQDALHDGDTIRAVIRSSCSNQDGKTPSLTQPGKDSQERLIRDTYRKAGLDMDSTRYFEAHGTGTPVGDPIEAGAIGAVFRRYRSPAEPLYVGSVKSNIGHLEGASGVAGVIKVVLALERGIIPPNSINFERLNPKIDADFLNIRVPTEALPWPCEGLRRASVQSFGFGGSNSHVILEDAYNYLSLHGLKGNHTTIPRPLSDDRLLSHVNHVNEHVDSAKGASQVLEKVNGANGVSHTNGANAVCGDNGTSVKQLSESDPRVLVWSTADESGLVRLTEAWREYLAGFDISHATAKIYLRNLAYTLASRRTHLSWRTFSVATDCKVYDLIGQMSTPIKAADSPKLAFIFTGQGAQWYAMGKELLDRYSVFRKSMVEAGVYLRRLGCSWNPVDELLRGQGETNINNTQYSQTLCTALQVALIDLLEYFNVRPTAVIGHSSGEIAAGYAAKALSRESAWKVAYYRGMLASQLNEINSMRGGMLAVGLSISDAQTYLDKVSTEFGNSRLVIACMNSPKNQTISGDEIHLDRLEAFLKEDQAFARRLKVTVAYHSFQMQEISEQYLSCMGNLTTQGPQKTPPIMVSSVTGKRINNDVISQPEYWVRNMLQPVLFSDALSSLCAHSSANKVKKLDGSHHRLVSINELIEIGPHSALQGPLKEILRSLDHDNDIRYISILKRNVSAVHSTLEAAGRLHCIGYPINLARVNGESTIDFSDTPPKTLTDLPTYSFNHGQTYWHESRISKGNRFRRFGRMDLLGTPSQDWNPLEAKWRNIIRVSELPWVEDHKINSAILYPAAGMIVMAIEAAKQLTDQSHEISGFIAKNIAFQAALNIPTTAEGIECNMCLRPRNNSDEKDSGWFDFRLLTYDGDSWVENCNGSIQVVYATKESEVDEGNEAHIWSENHHQQYQDSLRKCKVSLDPSNFYDHLLRCGYNYGPAFRPIMSLAYDGDQGIVSEVKTFQWSNYEGANFAQPHTVHPTTFDAILQTVFTSFTKGATELMPTMIPTYVDRLWISNKGLSYPEVDLIKVYATTRWTGLRENDSAATALDATARKVLVELEGLKTTVVSSTDTADDTEQNLVSRCHNIDWKPDIDLISVNDIRFLCDAVVGNEVEPVSFYTDVDFLVTSFIQRTLKQLGDSFASTIKPNHLAKSYYDWMTHRMRLLHDGNTPFSSPEWTARLEDNDYIAQLTERIASTNKQGIFITTVGRNLVKILTGEMDALNVLFQGDLVNDFYYEVFSLIPCLKQLRVYLDSYMHKYPGAKILEVGAGTGSFTHQIMKSLTMHEDTKESIPRYGNFDYTDISPFFFESAQERYRGHGKRMRFKTLNIELDPDSQGFECGTYDLVFAAAVLHATTELEASLKNCRKLLRPGGKLILYEFTRPDVFRTAFVFGLLEGWWLSSEKYRKWGPCIGLDKWNELLEQTGFSGNQTVLIDYEDPICHEYSVIISTAVSKPPMTVASTDLVVIRGAGQDQLAGDVKSALQASENFAVEVASVDQVLDKSLHSESTVVFLLEMNQPVWFTMSPGLFEKLHKILTTASKVLWVGRGGGLDSPSPEFRLADGLFRVLNSELGGAVVVSLSLETKGSLSSHQIDHISKVSQLLTTQQDFDTEYIEHGGLLHVNRLIEATALDKEIHKRQLPKQRKQARFGGDIPLRLTIGSPGLLNTFYFIEDKETNLELQPDELEVRVESVGINFRDLLIALGRLDTTTIGCECAGIITRLGANCKGLEVGMRVAACCMDSYKTFVRLKYWAVAKIPDGMTSSVAAAVTVNHTTAWYSLFEVARVQSGETILIHSGAGGTGQAAIQVAQHLGADVFTTVGTKEKKQFLMKRYNIPAEHIFSSRDTVFAQSLRRLTSGRGVDVVFNSLAGEELAASWECIAPYGRFIEIGKKDIYARSKLQMFHFARNVTFSAVDLAAMSIERPKKLIKALDAVLSLVEMGTLTPSEPMQVYGIAELEKAFRNMQSGKNSGKTVIDLRADDQVEMVLDTKPSFYFDENSTYVIAGGLGGLGRGVSRWFAQRGARNLILLSRSGAQSSDAQALVNDLTSQGVCVRTPACNIADLDLLKATLDECLREMPPVRGCIQASMVLKDATFESMTFESWEATILPKVHGSWNLHTLLPNGMDFFVMFSSITGITGARNTFQDALARYRVGKGERGTALDLGAFLDAGVLRENTRLRQKFNAEAIFDPVTESELFALLDYYCHPNEPHCTPLRCQTVIGVGIAPALRRHGLDMAYWLNKPSFRQIVLSESKDESETKQADRVNFQGIFAAASSLAEVVDAVTDALVMKLAKTLSLAQNELDKSRPMHSYGVDSLVAIELRNWFSKELHADIAIFDILGSATISNVAALAAAKSGYRKDEWMD